VLRLLLAPVHAVQHRLEGGDVNVRARDLLRGYAQMPHNTHLQRTVMPRRARAAGAALPLCACGAHDPSSGGR
jgi:hypothetical protein